MNYFYKNLSIWLIIGLVGLLVFNLIQKPPEDINYVKYNDFINKVKKNRLNEVVIEGDTVTWTTSKGNEKYKTVIPTESDALPYLLEADVNMTVKEEEEPHWFLKTLLTWVPLFLIIGLWFFFMRGGVRQGGGGGNKAMAFGKNRARLIDSEKSDVSFQDVAGVDEAKEELVEVVEFLKEPDKFTEAGARIPAGVLLYGEPGTGKTLMAKAIAGEAGVPFYSISGSNFVEMYVGVGASRVRDLFLEGKKKAPCIIFIDEIDAVGRHRSAGGGGGGNDEREQTLNQLLVEMDGFEPHDHVIVIAATNRQDILDPALLRPGRFDRQVLVPLPDVRGREKILQVHGKKIRAADDLDWSVIAKGTPGFSGAQLANMVNEAALLVTRESPGERVSMKIMEQAKDKVMMGAERRSLIITDREKKITACHEAGHALVAWMLPGVDPVHKVTIIPRGKALGVTMQLPEEERQSQDRNYLFNNMCTLLGGRIAEEIVFEEMTTGAANDIERVSDMARKMVCEWGMNSDIGPITFKVSDPLQGKPGQIMSEATAREIDVAVKSLVQSAYDKAEDILSRNRAYLEKMTDVLLERETISRDDIQEIISE
ncbi:MAG: ATP-dependent zinc metalloprotease FtsH [Desulfurivibrionaceae bacterium]